MCSLACWLSRYCDIICTCTYYYLLVPVIRISSHSHTAGNHPSVWGKTPGHKHYDFCFLVKGLGLGSGVWQVYYILGLIFGSLAIFFINYDNIVRTKSVAVADL